MASLSKTFAAADESVEHETAHHDPFWMAADLFEYTLAATSPSLGATDIEAFFRDEEEDPSWREQEEDENGWLDPDRKYWWDEWDTRARHADLDIMIAYLESALRYCDSISTADGFLTPRAATPLPKQPDYDLAFEMGFYVDKKTGRYGDRNFRKDLRAMIVFLERVRARNQDLLRVTDD